MSILNLNSTKATSFRLAYNSVYWWGYFNNGLFLLKTKSEDTNTYISNFSATKEIIASGFLTQTGTIMSLNNTNTNLTYYAINNYSLVYKLFDSNLDIGYKNK